MIDPSPKAPAPTSPTVAAGSPLPLASLPAFIETQFPVSKLSKESYKERKANNGQTLAGLGKWWGRKPLVLVRAAILGLLLPATDDPAADRQVFLALMTMDDDGLLLRLRAPLPPKAVYAQSTPCERDYSFTVENGKPKWKPGLTAAEKQRLQRRAFLRMGYDERLTYCKRPEEIDGAGPEAWSRINAHLGTNSETLPELVRELGERRFGHTPRVADAFCGGGSVPFEAARIGCEAYGSDLNPVAALLTWGALNIVGGGQEAVQRVQAAQRRVYEAVRQQVDEWGIERNEEGWIADAYLYCNEVVDPATGWRVPLAPSWVIGEGTRTVARLVPDQFNRKFEIEISQNVGPEEMAAAKAEGTWIGNSVLCPVESDGTYLPPDRRQGTSVQVIRGRSGLRRWEKDDLVPRATDVLQERLYCIRWCDPATGQRRYRAPTQADLQREAKVLSIARHHYVEWQTSGCLPSAPMEPGDQPNRAIVGRGWTYWHHFFNPRQLLMGGLLASMVNSHRLDPLERVGLLLTSARAADWNSRLSRWNPSAANEKGEQTFYDQSLSPLANYSYRPVAALHRTVCAELSNSDVQGEHQVVAADARAVDWSADLWITDPGYADAVLYEQVSEFFLAWYEKRLPELFPNWYADSKRALAIKGKDESFRRAMVECYRRFTELMPENGFQVVMFTHQDAEVWSDLALILWAAGLQVTAAWTIGTETGGAVKQGNLVQGTVLLVLRKRMGELRGDMSDVFPEVQAEVRRQLASMLALDPKEDPNFGDADYQLAAYAAALRVLTGYSAIDEIDVERELYRTRKKGERSPMAPLIERAVRIASDFLVPDGLDAAVWRKLSAEERLYLKGVEVEAHGEYREGVYQEFARGFGVHEYKSMLGSSAANQTRLKTPSEFKSRDLKGPGFAGSPLRLLLFAIHTTARENDPHPGRRYLKDELPEYWNSRQTILALLRFLANKPPAAMTHWAADVEAARLLLGSVENDSV
ncbi:MAG: anti-phage-associated DUF1156 domain-containing protein [Dehalococcoidia bacterium]